MSLTARFRITQSQLELLRLIMKIQSDTLKQVKLYSVACTSFLITQSNKNYSGIPVHAVVPKTIALMENPILSQLFCCKRIGKPAYKLLRKEATT